MIGNLECLPDNPTADDLPSDMDCVYAGNHPDECRRVGVVIDCAYCIRPWGSDFKKVRMWTPCCGRVRQGVKNGGTVSCPGCDWQWTLFILGSTNRMLSVGPRPRRKKKV
ncbi:hypothetical protein ACFW2V_12580 [Streptomyces sp. NPDC058947]|uniref:hypothetical protein n=1 Tax=Streptomyces sp. NPDC058947 TaxID=3346675 RepID=UPI003680C2E9